MGILSTLIWLPIIGGLVVLMSGRFAVERWLSLAISILVFVISLMLYTGFDSSTANSLEHFGQLKRMLIGEPWQGMCNGLERRFVVSKKLIQALVVPEGVSIEQLGAFALRGKAEPVELVGLA